MGGMVLNPRSPAQVPAVKDSPAHISLQLHSMPACKVVGGIYSLRGECRGWLQHG